MSINPSDSRDDKLKAAREVWEHALDHYNEQNKERRLCALFYHNSQGVGQWDRHDREFLEEEGRPVLTFNVLKPKIDALQGMLEDVRKRPAASPVGKEDTFLAEVQTILLDRARELVRADALERKVFSHGLVRGEGDVALDVVPDPADPSRYQFTAKRVPPHEIKWDTSSEEPDRCDAQWVTWDRWFTVAEFKNEYPEHADKAEEYLRAMNQDGMASEARFAYDAPSESSAHYRSDRDYEDERYSDYFDRKRKRIRVIHVEYVAPAKRVYLVDRDRGMSREIKPNLVQLVKQMQAEGDTIIADMELVTVFDQQVYWLDFVRDDVLYDEPSPQPFAGFSIVPFTCHYDDTDNTTYSPVRNLLDPQREVNKARSQELDTNIAQGKPGFIAEKSAIPNLDEFERQNNQGGAASIVEDGALTSGAIQPRPPAQRNDAGAKRAEDALVMVDRIGGIGADVDHVPSQPEALGTVQLRHRRAQASVSEIFEHAEVFQIALAEKLLEGIARAFPDYQIEEMLGDPQRFVVREGQVIELGQGPQGQPVPQRVAPIRDLRRRKQDIDLETTSENNTLKLMELGQLAHLTQLGVPVDPAIMVEKAISSRSDRERLLTFVQQQQQAAAQAGEVEREQLMAQLAAGLTQQAEELEEKRRHNIADEALEARGQQFDLLVGLSKLIADHATDPLEAELVENTRARIEAGRFQRSQNAARAG